MAARSRAIWRILFGLVAIWFSISATTSFAENHALIVGVSKYPNLEDKYSLKGPANDAVLVRDYLLNSAPVQFDPENLIVLADGVEGAGDPTLEGIRLAFQSIERRAQPGDFVYLHFSGHGSQAPALVPEEELDGLDELFLPADIGPWNDEIGVVENALIDDEIGELIAGLQMAGAGVWAVFDSCHSGTVTRGLGKENAGDEEVSRKLDPAALGLSNEIMSSVDLVRTRGGEAVEEPAALVESKVQEGVFVAFYAAQTNQTTPEMNQPANQPGRKPHGLFTYTLFEAMAQNPHLSYRQLGQEVLRRYTVNYRVQPTPLFEGDLDAQLFGSTRTDRVQQWPLADTLDGYTIPAGRLHGLSQEEELIVVPTPAAANDASVATLRVSDLFDLSAGLVSAQSSFLALDSGVYVRKTSNEIAFSLALAGFSQDTPAEHAALAEEVERALNEIDANALRLKLVGASEAADLRLIIAQDQLWLAGPDGMLTTEGPEKTPGIKLAGRTADEVTGLLTDNLTRIARATNLLKLGEVYRAGDLDADLKLKTRSRESPQFSYLETASVADVFPGDEMHIEVNNSAANPIDINLLYVGSDYSISFVHNARINGGETLNKKLGRFTDKSFGRERLIMITSLAKPQSAVEDLSWLAQGGIERTRAVNQARPFAQALNEAGFGSTTRSFLADTSEDGAAGGAISQVEFRVRRRQP